MSGRIIVISGASTGLGLSLASRFLKAEDTVYGVTRTRNHWDLAKKNLSNHSSSFFLYQLDCSREAEVKQFFSTVRKQAGKIDLLVNNAGYANRPVRFEKETLKEFEKNLSDNLISTFLMCKHALPIFLKQKDGWIINISSTAGKRAVPGMAAYSAAKFGVLALSQSIAKENLSAGFKCITVCPGGMNTAMRVKVFGKEDAEKQQSADFVADKILEMIDGKIAVESGGDLCIRHGKITAVNPPPEA